MPLDADTIVDRRRMAQADVLARARGGARHWRSDALGAALASRTSMLTGQPGGSIARPGLA
jgi:hypothetical protein